MSTKYLKNRTLNKSLNNLACWGYWEKTECYIPNSTRENAIWLEALDGEFTYILKTRPDRATRFSRGLAWLACS
jgi:hypothetical protein